MTEMVFSTLAGTLNLRKGSVWPAPTETFGWSPHASSSPQRWEGRQQVELMGDEFEKWRRSTHEHPSYKCENVHFRNDSPHLVVQEVRGFQAVLGFLVLKLEERRNVGVCAFVGLVKNDLNHLRKY